jgi:hypothetical protein
MDIVPLGLYLSHLFDLIYKLNYAAEGVSSNYTVNLFPS